MISQHLIFAGIGGSLIGLSAALFLLMNGRIAGISGLTAQATKLTRDGSLPTALIFLLGLIGGALAARYLLGWPRIQITASAPLLIIGGLLVGYGTRLGSGCTSGHGVCGIARFSIRSLVATAVFITMAIVTVFIVKLVEGAV